MKRNIFEEIKRLSYGEAGPSGLSSDIMGPRSASTDLHREASEKPWYLWEYVGPGSKDSRKWGWHKVREVQPNADALEWLRLSQGDAGYIAALAQKQPLEKRKGDTSQGTDRFWTFPKQEADRLNRAALMKFKDIPGTESDNTQNGFKGKLQYYSEHRQSRKDPLDSLHGDFEVTEAVNMGKAREYAKTLKELAAGMISATAADRATLVGSFVRMMNMMPRMARALGNPSYGRKLATWMEANAEALKGEEPDEE